MAPRVFISHSSKDEKVAELICKAVEKRGYACWLAARDVQPGENFQEAIARAILDAGVMLLVFSANTNNSDEIKKELALASQSKLLVIPLRVEDVRPSFALSYELATRQWIDMFTDWETALEHLVERIARALEPAATSTKAPVAEPRETLAAVPPKPARTRRRLIPALALVVAALGLAGLVWWETGVRTSNPIVVNHNGGQPKPTPPPDPVPESSGIAGSRPLTPEEERALKPGDRFRECGQGCPEMATIPAGTYSMGSAPTEYGRDRDESPQHAVTIAKAFAVSRFDVTFAEWDVCVAAGFCRQRPSDHGWGRGKQPVINVTWNDAHEYLDWLSGTTGRKYRLLTETEWEYAARAGVQTAYYWGDYIGRGNANCNGCGSEWDRRQTSPVGSFKANQFGLFDMAGNVWQWVEDCYRDSYAGTPSDGSTVASTDCRNRVLRGGSWKDAPQYLRAASRLPYSANVRANNVSFRVARTLTP